MNTLMISARVHQTNLDTLCFLIWEAGILGLQEQPLETELFAPQKGTEFREPNNTSDWMADEKIIESEWVRLKIHLSEDASLREKIKKLLEENSAQVESVEVIGPENYLENYKNSVKGMSFGEDFWIGPPWIEADKIPSSTEKTIFIHPAMAFGTGEHPTTQMALESIWENKKLKPQRIIDIGAGSGVLSIGCAKWLPSSELTATDTDALCEEEIKKNFALNGLPENIRILCGENSSLERLIQDNERFDWVISNIYGEVLAALSPQIHQLLNAGGLWIATGILDGHARQVFESAISQNFTIKKILKREDFSPHNDHLWLCYEIST